MKKFKKSRTRNDTKEGKENLAGYYYWTLSINRSGCTGIRRKLIFQVINNAGGNRVSATQTSRINNASRTFRVVQITEALFQLPPRLPTDFPPLLIFPPPLIFRTFREFSFFFSRAIIFPAFLTFSRRYVSLCHALNLPSLFIKDYTVWNVQN